MKATRHVAGWLENLSRGVAWAERRVLVGLAVALTGLILLNVVTRAFSVAIYWVDELAIYAMVWMVFIGASYAIHSQEQLRVTLVLNALKPRVKNWVALGLDAIVLAFSLFLLVLCWRWYDLPGLLAADFELAAFADATLNFIYEEPTNTLGVRKIWVWLVMPITALTATIHAFKSMLTGVLSWP